MDTMIRNNSGRGTPSSANGGGFAQHARDEATVELVAEAEEWDEPEEPRGQSFTFPAHRLHTAVSQIEKANRRLDKLGIEERFEYETEEEVRHEDGAAVRYVHLTLARPRIGFGGWSMTGVHQFTADRKGVLSYWTGDEKDAPSHPAAPEDGHCDYCGKTRARGSVYTLHSDTEGDKQVGKNCLEAFLGIKPTGLWALEFELDPELEERDDQDYGRGSRSVVFAAEDLIVLGLAASADGEDFVSMGAATMQEPSTLSAVLSGGGGDIETAGTPERRKLARTMLKWITDRPYNPDVDSDYIQKLKAAVAGEDRWVGKKQLGTAISLISAYNNELRWAAEAEAMGRARELRGPRAQEFLGEVKQRLTDIHAEVVSTTETAGYADNTLKTIVNLVDDQGHVITWFASDLKVFEPGQKVIVKGTVAKHNIFKGDHQTVISRAVITDPATGNELGDFFDPLGDGSGS
jgi:hypothetical protein